MFLILTKFFFFFFLPTSGDCWPVLWNCCKKANIPKFALMPMKKWPASSFLMHLLFLWSTKILRRTLQRKRILVGKPRWMWHFGRLQDRSNPLKDQTQNQVFEHLKQKGKSWKLKILTNFADPTTWILSKEKKLNCEDSLNHLNQWYWNYFYYSSNSNF